MILAAVLTWNLVKGTLFIGLPADVTVVQVCIDDWACYVPSNPQVLVVEWAGSNPSMMRAECERDGKRMWVEAYATPLYVS